MITIYVEDTECISQKAYDDVVAALDIRELTCTCGNSKCLIHHGSYQRRVKASAGEFRLRVNRVKCTACGCTHALLITSIIPYSQIPLNEQLTIINCYESKSGYDIIYNPNHSIDENNIGAVILRYCVYWKKRILQHNISLSPLRSLLKNCFRIFHRQFMQVKETPNILFEIPT